MSIKNYKKFERIVNQKYLPCKYSNSLYILNYIAFTKMLVYINYIEQILV